MKVVCLVENTSSDKNLKAKHGLSFYIETSKHKILFDIGSNSIFLENAKKINIDIADIDSLVISHGHVDHGGALHQFLKKNSKAKIYIRKSALEIHATKILLFNIDVGLPHNLEDNPRFIFTDKTHKIDSELTLFVAENKEFELPSGNTKLFMKKHGSYIHDDFSHEQSLLLSAKNKTIVFGGCAHSGVVNILKQAQELSGENVDSIISGFHLYNPISKKQENEAYIKKLSAALQMFHTDYYTCHCTGKIPYELLKEGLSDQLHYIATGDCLLF